MPNCENCGKEFPGGISSKGKPYTKCKECARTAFKSMIQDQKDLRDNNLANFAQILKDALNAGNIAAKTVTPVPMIVQQHRNQLDDSSPVVKQWGVSEGVCGFAWVKIRPANCAFANWLKKQGYQHSHYDKAVLITDRLPTQSYERKTAWASAVAKHLRENIAALTTGKSKIDIYADSRLD